MRFLTKDSIKNAFTIVFIFIYWTLLCLAFNYIGYSASIFFGVAAIVFVAFADERKVIPFLFSTLLFTSIFKFDQSSFSVSVLLYFVFIVKSFFKERLLHVDHKIAILVSMTILQLLVLLINDGSFYYLFSFILNLFLAFILIFYLNKTNDKRTFYHLISLLFVGCCFISTMASLLLPNILSFVGYQYSSVFINGILTNRFSGLVGDSNYYAQIVLIAVSLTIGAFFDKTFSAFAKVLMLVISMFLVYETMNTHSKSFFIMLFIIFVLVIFYFLTDQTFSKLRPLFFVIIPLFAIFGFYFYRYLSGLVFERITDSVDLTSGRFTIWSKYLNLWFERPDVFLFGGGVNNARNLIQPAETAHNILIEAISDLGIVGLFLFVFLVVDSIKQSLLSLAKPQFLFIIVFLFTSMALSVSSFDLLYFILPMAVCVPTNYKNDCINFASKHSNNYKNRYVF